jgi:molybdopterin-synthase adenylyltransferase
MRPISPLTDAERSLSEWQLSVGGLGEEGQQRLKAASVLISRCGGVGGAAACELAMAGVGRILLAHGGALKPSDLNRQMLMRHEGLDQPRAEMAARRLRELNPCITVEAFPENVTEENAARLVGEVDLVMDCAPLFEERYRLNREAVRQRKPLVVSAMYDMEVQVTTMLPGRTPCFACLCPEAPATWTRRFPVLGAVAGVTGCLGAAEAIKVLAGFGEPLLGRMLVGDLRRMSFRVVKTWRDPRCPVCSASG